MLEIDPRATAALRGSHEIQLDVQLCRYGQVEETGLARYVTGGTLEVRNLAVGRRLSLDFGGFGSSAEARQLREELRPITFRDLFVRWLVPIPGLPEPLPVPLGLFRIDEVGLERENVFTLDADDYGSVLEVARLEEPEGVSAGTDPAAFIERLAVEGYPRLAGVDLPPTDLTLPQLLLDERAGRFTALRRAARAVGWLLEFTIDRVDPVLVARPLVTEAGSREPVWAFAVDVPDRERNIVDSSEEATAAGVYNVFIVEGEGDDPEDPPRGKAVITSGPLSVDEIGRRPTWRAFPFARTDAMALAAARTYAAGAGQLDREPELVALPNPALQPLDPIAYQQESGDPVEQFLLDGYDLELTESSSPMRVELLQTVDLTDPEVTS